MKTYRIKKEIVLMKEQKLNSEESLENKVKKITQNRKEKDKEKYFGGKKSQSQNNAYYDPIYVKF